MRTAKSRAFERPLDRTLAAVRKRARTLGPAALLALLCASPALAESAWVTSEVRLNLRTGAGTKFRIVGVMVTGDSVEILRRKNDWTQIESDDGRQGWIPAGYLRSQPPAEVRLVKAERELERLRTQFENSSADVSKLRESNAEISGREKEQLEEIKHLTLENLNLRAGPNWPEWITGASILSVGMMVGALLRSWSRRSTPRIKL